MGFWGLGERLSCAKNGWTNLNDLQYMSDDVFLRKELPFGGYDDCTCVKIFSSINFFNCD